MKEKPQEFDSPDQVRRHDETLFIELWYPRTDGAVKTIEIGLVDVRAADGIQVSYDFDRDGWVIKQASTFSWPTDDKEFDPDYQEVAFVKAWAREKTTGTG